MFTGNETSTDNHSISKAFTREDFDRVRLELATAVAATYHLDHTHCLT